MKITAAKTFVLEHPRPNGTAESRGSGGSRTSLVIKLETDAGVSGWGETMPFGGVRELIEELYAPVLVGRNPVAHRALWRALWGANFGNGMALGGVAIALDDLRGKALGVPVAELYGGRLRDRALLYVSALWPNDVDSPGAQDPRAATEMVARGFRALKIRIGGEPIRQDLAAISAVREVVGPEIKLMVDANGAYTLGTAIEVGRELERLGVHWFEEPLPQGSFDYAGYEALRNKLDIPIAAGECLTSRGRFRDAIARRVMDIVQPDATLAGGIGECLFVAELAQLWGISCTPHCCGGALAVAATAHLVSLLPDASWSRNTNSPMLEVDTVENPIRDDLLVRPLETRDGFLTVPRGPGLGVEVDEDKLRLYSKP